jgi:hypothetical protein
MFLFEVSAPSGAVCTPSRRSGPTAGLDHWIPPFAIFSRTAPARNLDKTSPRQDPEQHNGLIRNILSKTGLVQSILSQNGLIQQLLSQHGLVQIILYYKCICRYTYMYVCTCFRVDVTSTSTRHACCSHPLVMRAARSAAPSTRRLLLGRLLLGQQVLWSTRRLLLGQQVLWWRICRWGRAHHVQGWRMCRWGRAHLWWRTCRWGRAQPRCMDAQWPCPVRRRRRLSRNRSWGTRTRPGEPRP